MHKNARKLTDRLIESLASPASRYPLSLFHGKMGLVIYLYLMSRLEGETKYEQTAEELLDEIIAALLPTHPIGVADGLAGISLGVTFLIKKGFIEGDINELSEDIDNAVFKRLSLEDYRAGMSAIELIHLLFYLCSRLEEQTDPDRRFILEELAIRVINTLYTIIREGFFDEYYSFSIYDYKTPPFIWILGRFLSMGFYTDRIGMIIETLTHQIISRLPILHSNRLYVLAAVLPILPYVKDPRWKDYAQMLHREIDIEHILQSEMLDRNIFFISGLPTIYLLLCYINRNYPDYEIPFDPRVIHKRITDSDAWAALEKDHYHPFHCGLADGFPGAQLALTLIEKNITTL